MPVQCAQHIDSHTSRMYSRREKTRHTNKRMNESENILINFHQILWKLHLSTRANFDKGKRNRLSSEFRRVLHRWKIFQC